MTRPVPDEKKAHVRVRYAAVDSFVDSLWIRYVIRKRYPIRQRRRALRYPHSTVDNATSFPHACGHSDTLGTERVR